MKIETNRKLLAPGLVLALLGLAAAPAMAVDLATAQFDMTMPDGTTVPMWGFVLDNATPSCFTRAGAQARIDCVNNELGTPTVPGPRLVANTNTGNLVVRLTNTLQVPASVVIPGQEMPFSTACTAPVWTDGSSGARTAPDQRVRSFGCEAAPNGGREVYRWRTVENTQFQPGSYVYHSGTHPQVQVQMGLYGAARRNDPSGDAYAGVPFDMQRDLFFSEVDPAVHAAVAAGTFTGSTLDYNPKYFLLQRYQNQTTVVDATIDTGTIPPACIPGNFNENERILLRLYNAGLRELAPTMIGSHVDLVAEGGKAYQFAPRVYSTLLQPLSTKDIVLTPEYGGQFSLIERRLNLTDSAATGGGMQTCLAVAGAAGTNDPPVADAGGPYAATAGVPLQLAGSASDPNNDPLTLTWDFGDGSPPQSGVGVNPTYTYAADGNYTATLTADDGTAPPVADTAAVAVAANASPTAEANGPYEGRAIGFFPSGTVSPLTFSSAGSADPEGQALSYSWDFDASDGISVDSTEANPTWVYPGAGTFTATLTVSDGISAPGTDTATATVVQNARPVAAVSAPGESVSVTVTIDGCASSDGNGDALTYTWDFADGSGTQVTTDPTCSVVHTFPTMTANQAYTITLIVNDGYENSVPATTSITIFGTQGNDAPTANPDAFNPNEVAGTAIIAAPGVLANDTDDGNPAPPGALTAVLVSADEDLDNLTLNPDGSFSWTPGEPVGVLPFVYQANDSLLSSPPATVNVTREIRVTRAEYDEETDTWNVNGTSSATGRIRIWRGPTRSGGNNRIDANSVTGGNGVPIVGGSWSYVGPGRQGRDPGAFQSISVDNVATTTGCPTAPRCGMVENRTLIID